MFLKKRSLKSICTSLLALLLVAANLGFTLNQMICLHSGKSFYSVMGEQDDCCNNSEQNTPVVKTNCCDFSSTHYSLDNFNSEKSTVLQPDCLSALEVSPRILRSSSLSTDLAFSYSDFSLFGKSIVYFKRSLLI